MKTKPNEEWQQSYINYMDSLRKFNSQIRETIVYANLIEAENTEELAETLEKIQQLRKESKELSDMSDLVRP